MEKNCNPADSVRVLIETVNSDVQTRADRTEKDVLHEPEGLGEGVHFAITGLSYSQMQVAEVLAYALAMVEDDCDDEDAPSTAPLANAASEYLDSLINWRHKAIEAALATAKEIAHEK